MLLLSSLAFAESRGGGHPEPSSEMKAAFEACKSSGKPGDTAFDSCMESKGFKKPQGGGPGGGRPGQDEQQGSSSVSQ